MGGQWAEQPVGHALSVSAPQDPTSDHALFSRSEQSNSTLSAPQNENSRPYSSSRAHPSLLARHSNMLADRPSDMRRAPSKKFSLQHLQPIRQQEMQAPPLDGAFHKQAFRQRLSFSSYGKSGIASLLRSTAASFKDAIGTNKSSAPHVSHDKSQDSLHRGPIRRRISMPFRTRAGSFGNLVHTDAMTITPMPEEQQQQQHQHQHQHQQTLPARARPVIPANSGEAARRAVRELKVLDSTTGFLARKDSNLSLSRSDSNRESGIEFELDDEDDDDQDSFSSRQVIRKDPVDYLPTELADHIFSFLDSSSLRKCEQVSRAWHQTASDAIVWRSIFLSEYAGQPESTRSGLVGGRGIGKSKYVQQDWKKMYNARKTLARNWDSGRANATFLHGHTDSVYCVQFDETKIITGSRDRTIRVWSMERPHRCLRVIGVPEALHADRREQGNTHMLELPAHASVTADRAPLQHIDPAIYHVPRYCHNASILCLQYDDDMAVTGSSDCTLIVWDIGTWEPTRRLSRHTAGVLDIALDKEKIISCSKDSTICIWDRATGALLECVTGHRGPVNAVQLRGNLFVSASGEGSANLWNLETRHLGTPRATARTKLVRDFWSEERGLACVEFSEDARYILAGGNDHVIYKFDTATGDVAARMKGHDSLVRSLYLDTASGRVVSGSYDLSIRVWDYHTGAELMRFPAWATSWMLSAKADYRRIVSTSQDGRVSVVDFARNGRRNASAFDWTILKDERELLGPADQTVTPCVDFVIPERRSHLSRVKAESASAAER